jgi:hypothetical protein
LSGESAKSDGFPTLCGQTQNPPALRIVALQVSHQITLLKRSKKDVSVWTAALRPRRLRFCAHPRPAV